MLRRWHDQDGGLAVEPEVRSIIETQCLPGSRILEAGSGSGSITNWFAARYPEVRFVGVDISHIGVRMAYERTQNAEFRVADLKKLPFGDDTFDFSFSQSVIEHVVGWEDALAELYRVLVPGGSLLIRVGNAGVRNVSSRYRALLNLVLSRNRVYVEDPSFELKPDNWSDHQSNFDVQGIPSDTLLFMVRRLGFLVTYFSTRIHTLRESKNWQAQLVSYLDFWPFNHLGPTSIIVVAKPRRLSRSQVARYA